MCWAHISDADGDLGRAGRAGRALHLAMKSGCPPLRATDTGVRRGQQHANVRCVLAALVLVAGHPAHQEVMRCARAWRSELTEIFN